MHGLDVEAQLAVEPEQEDALLPGLHEFAQWYRVARNPAGEVMALMPYTIRIE